MPASTALQDMHTAEQQLVDLTGESTNAPSGSALAENEQGEVAVARDVFASDIDTAATACRSDAAQACAGSAAAEGGEIPRDPVAKQVAEAPGAILSRSDSARLV